MDGCLVLGKLPTICFLFHFSPTWSDSKCLPTRLVHSLSTVWSTQSVPFWEGFQKKVLWWKSGMEHRNLFWSLMLHLSDRYSRRRQCGFLGFHPLLCCQVLSSQRTTEATKSTGNTTDEEPIQDPDERVFLLNPAGQVPCRTSSGCPPETLMGNISWGTKSDT